MSLVNDMLKDLEQRDRCAGQARQQFADLDCADNYQMADKINARINPLFLVLMLAALTLAAGGWYWFQLDVPNGGVFSVVDTLAVPTELITVPPLAASSVALTEIVPAEIVLKELNSNTNVLVEEDVNPIMVPVPDQVEVQIEVAKVVEVQSNVKAQIPPAANPVVKPEPVATWPATELSIKPSIKSLDREFSYKANNLILENRLQDAKILLNEVLVDYPQLTVCKEKLFEVLLLQKERDQALEQLNQLSHLKQYQRAFFAAKVEVAFEQWQAAADVLESFKPSVNTAAHYYALRGAVYYRLGRHRDSINQYQQLLVINKQQSAYWLGLAISSDALGERSQALEAFRFARQYGGLDANTFAYVEQRISDLSQVPRAG